jgi:deazaflavin-dependent oxidoreductase (nitroreductase family)
MLNAEANPDVEVEVETERFRGRATVLREGPERDRLYAAQAAVWPAFAEYEQKTRRTIPVIVLERAG